MWEYILMGWALGSIPAAFLGGLLFARLRKMPAAPLAWIPGEPTAEKPGAPDHSPPSREAEVMTLREVAPEQYELLVEQTDGTFEPTGERLAAGLDPHREVMRLGALDGKSYSARMI